MRKEQCVKLVCEVFGSVDCTDPLQDAIESMMKFAGVYICPVRRNKQWVWRDVEVIVEKDEVCCECGEMINGGNKAHFVKSNNESGFRCNFCHKISLEHCSLLGHLRETVKRKYGLDYLTGEFVEEE